MTAMNAGRASEAFEEAEVQDAFENAVREFINSRQFDEYDVEYALSLCSEHSRERMEKAQKKESALYGLLSEIVGSCNSRYLVDYSDNQNEIASIHMEAEYRHGAMDAFRLFRMFLAADDRRSA